MKWQTGAYDSHANFSFILPYQFLLLCRLVDKTPEEVIRDFTDNLACDSWNRAGRDQAKQFLFEYFLAMGYGQDRYKDEEIRQMFAEMDALGSLFPVKGKMKLIDLYAKWRDKQHTYWFKKWFQKIRRKV